jgi:hypothetical protein
MDKIESQQSLVFNGPFEAGVRAVAILTTAYPKAFDIQRLTAFDYLLLNTAQLGGPNDLHPKTPMRTPATQVRRSVVQDGLHLMMTRDLVSRHVELGGIVYAAGEMAMTFMDALRSEYFTALKDRARWLVSHLAAYDNIDFERLMRGFFDEWVMEFQHLGQSLGGAA